MTLECGAGVVSSLIFVSFLAGWSEEKWGIQG
jgi:hypothetical protein